MRWGVAGHQQGSRALLNGGNGAEAEADVESNDSWSAGDGLEQRPSERCRRLPVSEAVAPLLEDYEVPGYIINPDESRFLLRWDIFIAVLLVIVAILAPFETAFLEVNFDGLFVINRFIDVAFATDLVLQFFTIRKDENNKDIVRHCDIAKAYLKGWFWVDFSSIVPVDAIMMLMGRKTNSALDSLRTVKVVRLMRFLRLVRLLRLSKFQVIIARWHANVGMSYALLAVLRFVVYILGVSHWMACIWGFMAMQVPSDATLDEDLSWMETLLGVERAARTMQNPAKVYILSLYWAVATLTSIGYGDIVPNSLTEHTICICCMLVMASLWAYTIGAMCSVVSTMRPHENIFRQNMDAFNEFMDDFNMPVEMRKKLRRFFYESKDIMRQRVEKATIMQLSPALQGEVLYYLHHDWLEKVWYFRGPGGDGELRGVGGVDHAFIIEAARCLELKLHGPKEVVGRERTLFIVRRGICVRMSFEAHMESSSELLLRPLPRPRQRRRAGSGSPSRQKAGSEELGFYERWWPRVYIRGSFWGEDFFLTNEKLRDEAPAMAVSYMEVITFDVSGLLDLLPDFPEVKVSFLQARIQLAMMRAMKKICRVLRHMRTTRTHRDLARVDAMEMVTDIMADRWPGSPVAAKGSRASSTTVDFNDVGSAVPQAASRRRKANIFRNSTISFSVKAQPVVGRLENLQSQVTLLSSKQEQFEEKLDEVGRTLRSVLSTLTELSGKVERVGLESAGGNDRSGPISRVFNKGRGSERASRTSTQSVAVPEPIPPFVVR